MALAKVSHARGEREAERERVIERPALHSGKGQTLHLRCIDLTPGQVLLVSSTNEIVAASAAELPTCSLTYLEEGQTGSKQPLRRMPEGAGARVMMGTRENTTVAVLTCELIHEVGDYFEVSTGDSEVVARIDVGCQAGDWGVE